MERLTRSRCAGFTLLEVMITLVVFIVAFGGLSALLVLNVQSISQVRERSLVVHSLRETAEKVRSAPFKEIVLDYQSYPFAIGEINATGTVQLFLNETEVSQDSQVLGLPRDLDGDGLVQSTDVSATYTLLPVKIEVSWTAQNGPETEALYMLLSQEKS